MNAAPWGTAIGGSKRAYSTAIVKLSDRVAIEWIEGKSLDEAEHRELVSSWPGTITAAMVTPPSGVPRIAVSMYAQWVRTHGRAGGNVIASDGSAHRVVSDLSTFIAKKDGHRVLAAGDMNILRGYGEHGDEYWAARYRTVFDRMEAMGLPCVGPEYRAAPDRDDRDDRNLSAGHRRRSGVAAHRSDTPPRSKVGIEPWPRLQTHPAKHSDMSFQEKCMPRIYP